MSLRTWAIKPGEAKALSAEARVMFLVRCVQRAEPWLPKSAVKKARELQDLGAIACNRLDGTEDERLGVATTTRR